MSTADRSSDIYTSNVIGQIFDDRQPLTIETGKAIYRDQIIGRWKKAQKADTWLSWMMLGEYLNGCFVFNLNGSDYNGEIIDLAFLAVARSKMTEDRF